MSAKTRFLVCLMIGSLIALAAADISGQWVADVPGRDGQTQQTTFTFKVEGDKLTGTVTTQRGDAPISDGKIARDEITFSQTRGGDNPMKIIYKGKIAGDEIKFTRQREGGQGQAREFTAKRKPS